MTEYKKQQSYSTIKQTECDPQDGNLVDGGGGGVMMLQVVPSHVGMTITCRDDFPWWLDPEKTISR